MFPRYILDLANNHNGSVEHGLEIIRAHAGALEHGPVGLKVQLRNHTGNYHGDAEYHEKFLKTHLTLDKMAELVQEARVLGYMTVATAFDPQSAGALGEFDFAKVASCSTKDWETLRAIADQGKPTIISTGGCIDDEIDDLVSFFEHRGIRFALMHCVSIYPTPIDALNLSAIAGMKARYPGVPIGWSTHEDPKLTSAVQMARAYGAELFERHIGLPAGLTSYSSTPEEIQAWIEADQAAEAMADTTYDYRVDEWRALERVARRFEPEQTKVNPLKKAVHQIKGMLNEAKIAIGSDFNTEFSHHKGPDQFDIVGCTILEMVNRDYCKKLIVVLPEQSHPSHYHKRKDETFAVLSGELSVYLDGRLRVLGPGDMLTVPPGVWHDFTSQEGCIFEEISTTHYNDDSFYADADIQKLDRKARKTKVRQWGRFEI